MTTLHLNIIDRIRYEKEFLKLKHEGKIPNTPDIVISTIYQLYSQEVYTSDTYIGAWLCYTAVVSNGQVTLSWVFIDKHWSTHFFTSIHVMHEHIAKTYKLNDLVHFISYAPRNDWCSISNGKMKIEKGKWNICVGRSS